MNTCKTPLFSYILSLEIVEEIFSYLPLPTVVEVMESENASITSVVRKRYYSNVALNFGEPPCEDGYSQIDDEVLSMKFSEFEALVNGDTFDQLHIEKFLIDVQMDFIDFTFLHKEVFTKASTVVADVVLKFSTNPKDHATFSWD
ncbi:hypothetical protein BABINDRAFT_87416 [Babjeviella inositovora NRRL Y-12698]|uniref:F-box domain-containing protein n=1 Tax=Babjeviella inositovora NRRL Y-12698 TaxID=984486 RepID=A0A1E3QMC6_9ASCO|nr:uncharacterized protein BABINDRAFT_87416 [Babjeviella inositovora NRRL Y-12698]ODQ78137.1 hypothetical protein BABINDRAFT_87416 [Babjeviella inositovora NRRL Y-12698]